MKVILVIPARYGSTRLPGKPLARIAGKMMVQRVYDVARAVTGVDRVVVATDDARIVDACAGFGAETIMTATDIPNGTERALAAVAGLNLKDDDVIVNLQGDAPITPPWVIQALVDGMRSNPSWDMATPASPLSWDALERLIEAKKTTPFSGTTVVMNKDGRALYFSKNIIPALRKPDTSQPKSPVFKHVGLYAYRLKTLKSYAALKPTALEELEGLEQLRALENNIAIHVVPVDFQGRRMESVDSPEDIIRVEAAIAQDGELV